MSDSRSEEKNIWAKLSNGESRHHHQQGNTSALMRDISDGCFDCYRGCKRGKGNEALNSMMSKPQRKALRRMIRLKCRGI